MVKGQRHDHNKYGQNSIFGASLSTSTLNDDTLNLFECIVGGSAIFGKQKTKING